MSLSRGTKWGSGTLTVTLYSDHWAWEKLTLDPGLTRMLPCSELRFSSSLCPNKQVRAIFASMVYTAVHRHPHHPMPLVPRCIPVSLLQPTLQRTATQAPQWCWWPSPGLPYHLVPTEKWSHWVFQSYVVDSSGMPTR